MLVVGFKPRTTYVLKEPSTNRAPAPSSFVCFFALGPLSKHTVQHNPETHSALTIKSYGGEKESKYLKDESKKFHSACQPWDSHFFLLTDFESLKKEGGVTFVFCPTLACEIASQMALASGQGDAGGAWRGRSVSDLLPLAWFLQPTLKLV